MSHSRHVQAARPALPFLVFCDHIWQRLGHEGGMSNADWHGLSFEERMAALEIWERAEFSTNEACRLWDASHPEVTDEEEQKDV